MDMFINTGAIFSPCRSYRYGLFREWDKSLPRILYLMLNPSIANECEDDPTIQRCQKRSTLLGFGRLDVRNLFGLVSTDPTALLSHPDPIGPDNDFHIMDAAKNAAMVICAWGRDGLLQGRGAAVSKMLLDAQIPLHCLQITPKSGQPQHPLYLSFNLQPIPYFPQT